MEGCDDAEEPMDIVVIVIDQNDNKPIFVKDTFLGEVPEASPRSKIFCSSCSLSGGLLGLTLLLFLDPFSRF